MPNIFKDEYELAIEKGCYIERDCYSKLLDWKNRKARNHNALFIRGARRVGKSVLALELAHKEYKSFIKISFDRVNDDLKKKENLSLLNNLYDDLSFYYKEIRSQVAETEVFKDISETLITKILMGTLGCVPAYDRYFKSGLSLEGVGIQKYGNNSLIKVCEFYEKYNEELEVVRLNMNVAGLDYPQLKILDMGFWKI